MSFRDANIASPVAHHGYLGASMNSRRVGAILLQDVFNNFGSPVRLCDSDLAAHYPDAVVELVSGALLLLDGALQTATIARSGPGVVGLLETADPDNFDFSLWERLALRAPVTVEPPEPLEVHLDGYPLEMALAHCLEAVRVIAEAIGEAENGGDATPALDLMAVIAGARAGGWPRIDDLEP